ncbi:hypothetical protein [Mesorhizobium sp. DCY119]|uniref:hypothetical protein n=1 Tax=Mesorhizobium sp. DCY119 TaxID=2108445 RepID=UPI000E6BC740|nr:hypothetical protein [Mesorhizobium sp. DCY119]RJG44604.1 hypothetical protein D3Y55_10215 [Mesorhizobium sp. DCY119]
MNIQEILTTVSSKAGLDEPTTEKAVGTILSVLEHEAEGTRVAELFGSIPGSLDLARQYDVMAAQPAGGSGGGLFGSLTSALGGALGEKAGALINGISQLRSTGLDATQIRQAGTTLIQQAKTAAGPDVVNEIVESVPGLKGHFGL